MSTRATRIRLEVQGRPAADARVPLRTLERATTSLTELLAQITADRQAENAEPANVEWLVHDLRRGGPVLVVEAEVPPANDATGTARGVVEMLVEGMRSLETGGDVRGMLSYLALERIHGLASLLNDGAEAITVRGGGERVSLTTRGAARASELLGQRRSSVGSVEGTVETVSVHEARPNFSPFHAYDGHPITCLCDDELLEQAQAALRQKARVRVTGRIMRRFDGQVEAVEVTRIRALPESESLPKPEDVRGIDPDFTGGVPVADWLRTIDD